MCPSAVESRALLQAGRLSVADVVDRFLEAVGDDQIHAWEAIDADRLRRQAADLDALSAIEREALPLFGIPVGIKDNFDTFDLPTGYGSRIYTGNQPRRDTQIVWRLRATGALIAGKTKCAEFAWMTPPDTANPLDHLRTPGGSSSGSAAAVAAGHVPLALGTQTAGSVNRPASYCGVVGYTPSSGRYDRDRLALMSGRLDTIGTFARSIADLQLLDRAIRSRQPADLPPRESFNIGFAPTPFWDRIEPEAAAAIEAWLALARRSGLTIDSVELPDYARLAEAQETIQRADSARALADELAQSPELLSEALRLALVAGAAITDVEYRAAVDDGSILGAQMIAAMARYDAILTPSALDLPPAGLGFTGDPLMSRVWTLIHAPSISIPVACSATGLLAGLQLVATPGSDQLVQELAAQLLQLSG